MREVAVGTCMLVGSYFESGVGPELSVTCEVVTKRG